MTEKRALKRKAGKLLEILKKRGKPIYIMTHDHPDPDAMASAAGIHYLIKGRLGLRPRLVYGGMVERPENLTMKSYLRTRFRPIPPKLFNRDVSLVLVDAQPGGGNHSVPPGFRATAVIDHHPLNKETIKSPFWDVRPALGACATMVTEYLRSTETPIPKTLATALCYAISSETRDLGREASEEDIDTYIWLLRSANIRRLSWIEHSRVPREFFLSLHNTVEKAFVHKDIIGACLGKVSRPDLAAQMADLLLTHERMRWSICTAVFKDRITVSIRTTRAKARCSQLLRRMIGKAGSAGGHGMIAGGYLPIPPERRRDVEEMEKELMLKFVKALAPPGVSELPPLLGGERSPSETEGKPPS